MAYNIAFAKTSGLFKSSHSWFNSLFFSSSLWPRGMQVMLSPILTKDQLILFKNLLSKMKTNKETIPRLEQPGNKITFLVR